MTLRIRWTDPAIESLLRMPDWHAAERVVRAVASFAATGDGDVYRLRDDHAVTVRLRVQPYVVRMTLDPFEAFLYVWIIYQLKP
ncbi:MAG: hypothetical protein IT372_11660 [Polyangiaceae bacterium]|nr:hypothetical protein [Polyangiaceae bacterium]